MKKKLLYLFWIVLIVSALLSGQDGEALNRWVGAVWTGTMAERPLSATHDQIYAASDNKNFYQWNSTTGAWETTSASGGGSSWGTNDTIAVGDGRYSTIHDHAEYVSWTSVGVPVGTTLTAAGWLTSGNNWGTANVALTANGFNAADSTHCNGCHGLRTMKADLTGWTTSNGWNTLTEYEMHWYTISGSHLGVAKTKLNIKHTSTVWMTTGGTVTVRVRWNTSGGTAGVSGTMWTSQSFTPSARTVQNINYNCDFYFPTAGSGTCTANCTINSGTTAIAHFRGITCDSTQGGRLSVSYQWSTLLDWVQTNMMETQMGRY